MSNMNSKKVVIISPYLFSLTRGIERYTINLSNALVNQGVEVIIYTRKQKNGKLCEEINPKIKVRTVPYFRFYEDFISVLFYRLWLLIDNPSSTILNFMYHGEEYLPKSRKYLYILHSPASQIPSRYHYAAERVRKFSNIHIVAISQFVLQDALPYFKDKPMSLIYNGTDTDLFAPSKSKIPTDKFRIITPAAYEKRKGMHYMIEALADFKYRDIIEYDIYGSGDEEYRDFLMSLIKQYNLEDVVTLKGSVSNLPELEPKYDLFALLSSGEAFALTPIEAMACGLPLLVSNFPPYPEFVKDDFGFMIDRENVIDIQNVLITLIENPQYKQNMSLSARQASLAFSWNHVVQEYINIL